MADIRKPLKRGHSFNKIHESLIKHKDRVLSAAKFIENGGYEFCFLKILDGNAAFPCSFPKAWCVTRRSLDDPDENKRVAVRFSDLFDVGIIRKFIEKTHNIEMSLSEFQLTAFQRLASFLDGTEQAKTITKNFVKSECCWITALGTHVLRKLAVENSMLVTSDYNSKKQHCPCGCQTPIQYGDCSIGHKAVWHGSVGMLLGPVAILSAEEFNKDDINTESPAELKDARDKLIAETVVFSYLQNCGLVPTISLCKDWCKVFMYDPGYDLLYESMDFNLFDRTGQSFEITAILFIWFIINYGQFCVGVKDSHEKFGYISGFQASLPQSVLSIYENDITHGGLCNTDGEKNSKWFKGEFRNYKVMD